MEPLLTGTVNLDFGTSFSVKVNDLDTGVLGTSEVNTTSPSALSPGLSRLP